VSIRINPSLSKIAVNPSLSGKIAVLPHIGLTGTPAAQAVWDDNFVFVSHMNDNPDTSHIADSTSNGNNGTKVGANEPIEVAGMLGKAQSFDGDDDYITISNDSELWNNATGCIEVLAKSDASSRQTLVLFGSQNNDLLLDINSFCFIRVSASIKWSISTDGFGTTGYKYVALNQDGVQAKLYWDGTLKGSASGTDVTAWSNLLTTPVLYLAKVDASSAYLNGLECKVRISNIARTPEWIAATNKSITDALLTYGAISGQQTAVTISSSDIDGDLTDFPVYLNLSASSGKTSTDLSGLFTAIGNNWQRLHLRVDGRDCPMEVVSWDTGTPYAEIHAKIPYISSTANTDLVLSW
jgi:hypothetical protein